ncbi:MAG: DUF4184 family protein [Bacillota bacterium]
MNRRAYSLLCTWSLRTLRDWIIYIVSVSIGFLSHVAVDAFTHEGGYMVQQLTVLQSIVILNLPVYKILQHSLSMIGMMVIFGTIGVLLYKTDPYTKEIPFITYKQKLFYWGFAVMVAVFMSGCKLLLTSGGNIIGMLIVAPITGFSAGILFCSPPCSGEEPGIETNKGRGESSSALLGAEKFSLLKKLIRHIFKLFKTD